MSKIIHLYGNGGILSDSVNNGFHFDTIHDMLVFMCNRYEHPFTLKDLSIKYLYFDNRINRDVFMICTNRYYDEDYLSLYGKAQHCGLFYIGNEVHING